MRLPCTLLAASLLWLIAVPVDAGEYRERSRQLEALQEEMREVEETLARSRDERDSVIAELQALEQEIGRAARRLHELDASLNANRARIDELEAEREVREAGIEEQRRQLAEQIRGAYVMGRQEYLKLLLNLEDPASVERMLEYFDRVGKARNRRIAGALEALRALADVRRELDSERDMLAGLRRDREAQTEHLKMRRSERRELLARVESVIESDRDRLDRLAAEEQQLQRLIEELREALADLPERAEERAPFAEQRGRLQWPLRGRVAAAYGSTRGRGGDRWRGVLLAAERGTPVSAVSHGQVVFSDWLRGLGLLLIIDHGDGYMTLYGYNDSLYRDVGDWVDAGDIIAGAGDTGGAERVGLYFELREGGDPRNPLTWLRDRPDSDS